MPRPILPARLATADASENPSLPRISRVELKRRSAVSTACNSCRKQRTKCSGGRPSCATCVRKQILCEYETDPKESSSKAVKRKYEELKSQQTPYHRVFDAVRSRSEADAATIVRKIRRGELIDDIAREIEYGDLLLQTAVLPETNFRYVFPFSPKMPQYLLSQSNPYLDSLIYEWSMPSSAHEASGRIALQEQRTVAAEVNAPYLKPYHAAEIIDARLEAVVPSQWTAVCSDDVLMRKLLQAFFLQDHDWWTTFHKDYFLEDMLEMRHRLCTSLLVNAMLALSCNYYRGLSDRTEFWNPKTLGYRFLAEAKRLWEYEMHKDKLTTVQAGLLLHIIYSGAGADKIAFAYTTQACAIAHNIGLFMPGPVIQDNKLRDARNYTAWALYSWQSLMCFHYFRSPLAKEPPRCVLPPPEDSQWYGEFWLKYPLNKSLYPSNSGDVFRAKAEFAVILNDMGQRHFGGTAASQALSAIEVAEFYERFQSWYANLPESLSSRKAVLPSHLKVHMHYFQILLRLLQYPSINDDSAEGHASAMDRLSQSPREIVSYAKMSLETLLRAYYLRHGFELLDSYIISLLMESCLLAIDTLAMHPSENDTVALQSTILLLAKGIYAQGKSMFLGQLVFQLVSTKMDPKTISMLERVVKLEPLREQQSIGLEHVQMEWPVQITNMADNPVSKRLQRFLEGPITNEEG